MYIRCFRKLVPTFWRVHLISFSQVYLISQSDGWTRVYYGLFVCFNAYYMLLKFNINSLRHLVYNIHKIPKIKSIKIRPARWTTLSQLVPFTNGRRKMRSPEECDWCRPQDKTSKGCIMHRVPPCWVLCCEQRRGCGTGAPLGILRSSLLVGGP